MSEEKLKNVIQSEIEYVTRCLISSDFNQSHKVVMTKWLQSLQRIDDVCKNRNRY